MNKKGEIALAVFAGIVIVLTITGAFMTFSKGDKLYVANKDNKLFYDYNKCPSDINKILPENRVIFESENLAIKNGFEPAKGCI